MLVQGTYRPSMLHLWEGSEYIGTIENCGTHYLVSSPVSKSDRKFSTPTEGETWILTQYHESKTGQLKLAI